MSEVSVQKKLEKKIKKTQEANGKKEKKRNVNLKVK